MSELTAIDVLINPDDSMLQRAKSVNERFLKNVPSPPGFVLDEHHQPHTTTLQRYVRTADLDGVFEAVQGVAKSLDMSTLSFTAVEIKHMEVAALPGIGLTAIVVKPGQAVLDFQAALIEALKPFTEAGAPPTPRYAQKLSPTSTPRRLITSSTTSRPIVERTTSPTSRSVWRRRTSCHS
jgi:hypothetical protein